MWTDSPIERVFANYDESGEVTSLTCWINGRGVMPDASDDALFDLAASELHQIRGAKIRGARVVRWDARQPFAGGAYMHWAPGQIRRWAERMGQSAGRIHFAGGQFSLLFSQWDQFGFYALFDLIY